MAELFSSQEGQIQLANAQSEAARLVKIYRAVGDDSIGSDLARRVTARLMDAEAALAQYRADEAMLNHFIDTRR